MTIHEKLDYLMNNDFNNFGVIRAHSIYTDSKSASYIVPQDCIILAISSSSGGSGSISYNGEYTPIIAFNDNSYYVKVSFALVKVKAGTVITLKYSDNTAGMNSLYMIG